MTVTAAAVLPPVPPARSASVPWRPATYAEAVEHYLNAAALTTSSARIYRIALTTWGWLLAGQNAPRGPKRRGAQPPALPLAALDDPRTSLRLAAAFRARNTTVDATTAKRELCILRAALAWWRTQGWTTCDPVLTVSRHPSKTDHTQALTVEQIAALWQLDVPLREKTLWTMVHESAASVRQILRLNIEDLDLINHRARTSTRRGATAWIHWHTGTANLLPYLISHRTQGPLFLTQKRAPASTPTADTCPTTGRARLSCRQAQQLFTTATRHLVHPQNDPTATYTLNGWTLGQLRHRNAP